MWFTERRNKSMCSLPNRWYASSKILEKSTMWYFRKVCLNATPGLTNSTEF